MPCPVVVLSKLPGNHLCVHTTILPGQLHGIMILLHFLDISRRDGVHIEISMISWLNILQYQVS